MNIESGILLLEFRPKMWDMDISGLRAAILEATLLVRFCNVLRLFNMSVGCDMGIPGLEVAILELNSQLDRTVFLRTFWIVWPRGNQYKRCYFVAILYTSWDLSWVGWQRLSEVLHSLTYRFTREQQFFEIFALESTGMDSREVYWAISEENPSKLLH